MLMGNSLPAYPDADGKMPGTSPAGIPANRLSWHKGFNSHKIFRLHLSLKNGK